MKTNGAPEKLYLLPNGLISYCRRTDEDVEYTHTDGFIDKACEWIGNYLMDLGCPDDWMRDSQTIPSGEQLFRKAMKGGEK